MPKGLVISGEFGKIVVREKSEASFEIGELLIAESSKGKFLMQVYDLSYGSQITEQNRELIAGISLEDNEELVLFDEKLRNYNIAHLKNLITINNDKINISKSMPAIFSNIREVTAEDIKFLTKPKNPLLIGKLRSGSKTLDLDVFLEGDKIFSHHLLIAGTTGRGKSVLVSNILWNTLKEEICGMLVLDPHDEYFGRNSIGLKDHPKKERMSYYTPNNAPPGAKTLKINLSTIKPHNLYGVIDWSEPQQQAIVTFYRKYKERWIEAMLLDEQIENVTYMEGTLNVVKRRLMNLLSISVKDNSIITEGIFDKAFGKTTIKDIAKELEEKKTVLVDTSSFSGEAEILIGSMVAGEIFDRYKNYKMTGELEKKPVVSIILEEAPRVLGKEVLERGPNIFSTIAREGRKFKVGLAAITQLPSLLPREILANINTKIILGIEMKPERQAIIETASQDLSEDDRNIASLDKGEAIITSNFIKFATPIKIPNFIDLAKADITTQKTKFKPDFGGMKIG